MAKKKSKSKNKDNLLLIGLGVLIVIVVVIILAKGCQREAPVEQPVVEQAHQPEVQVEPAADALKGLEEVNCDETATIGYKSCSLLESGDVDFTILHQGAGTLLGFQYYIYDKTGAVVGEDAEMMVVEGGATASLTLPSSKFDNVDRVEVRPVMNFNGVDSICKNQRVIQLVSRC